MKEYKVMAHIHSLNGEMAGITVLEEVGNNDYIVNYKGCLLYTSPSPRD